MLNSLNSLGGSNWTSLLKSAFGFGSNTNLTDTKQQAGDTTNEIAKSAQQSQFSIGKNLMSVASGIAQGYSAIKDASKLPSSSQKAEGIADGAVGGIASVASAFGPIGQAIGGGLNIVNALGGSLLNGNKTAKAADNFKINSDVASSSAYSGVTAGADLAKQDGQAYKKAGLFGKIFTNTSNLKGEMTNSSNMQNQASNILNTNKQAMQAAAGSSNMFSTRNAMKNYGGNMWTNGTIQYGQSGMKIQSKSEVKNWMANYLNSSMYKTRSDNMKADKPNIQRFMNTEIVRNDDKGADDSNSGSKAVYAKSANQKDKIIMDYNEIRDQNIIGNPFESGVDDAGLMDPKTVLAHELSHVQRDLSPKEEYMIASSDSSEQGKKLFNDYKKNSKSPYYSSYINSNYKDGSKHDFVPEELKADLDALRFMMHKRGIYDTSKRDMNQNDWDKVTSDPSITKSFSFRRLMDHFDSKALINLNNKVANNTNPTAANITYAKAGMKIKPSHEGKFTEYKKRTGKSTEEALHSKDPKVKKMANFAKNARSWKHELGGTIMSRFRLNPETKTTETYNNYIGKVTAAAKSIDMTKVYAARKAAIAKKQEGGVLKEGSTFINNEDIKELDVVISHKEGGAINVIVDGAFHSRKHDLKDHPDFEDANITHKGIPVVSDSDGGIVQHAEVETNELIMHLTLSKKLEKLMKKGTEEAALEAGKLLAKELMENTKDSQSKIIENA